MLWRRGALGGQKGKRRRHIRYTPLSRTACHVPSRVAAIPDPACGKTADAKHCLLERGQDATDSRVGYLSLEDRDDFNKDADAKPSHGPSHIQHGNRLCCSLEDPTNHKEHCSEDQGPTTTQWIRKAGCEGPKEGSLCYSIVSCPIPCGRKMSREHTCREESNNCPASRRRFNG